VVLWAVMVGHTRVLPGPCGIDSAPLISLLWVCCSWTRRPMATTLTRSLRMLPLQSLQKRSCDGINPDEVFDCSRTRLSCGLAGCDGPQQQRAARSQGTMAAVCKHAQCMRHDIGAVQRGSRGFRARWRTLKLKFKVLRRWLNCSVQVQSAAPLAKLFSTCTVPRLCHCGLVLKSEVYS
jgi:hypothetical protein